MSVEGILFYGVTIPGQDPGWRQLRAQYDDEYGIANIGRMLVEHFHNDLLNDKQWNKRFRKWAGDYVGALEQSLSDDEVFGGCRLNEYGDRRGDGGGYYIAVCGTEIVGRTEGTRVDIEMLRSHSRSEWDTRLRDFCERLGIGFSYPRWQLAFWWC